MALLTIGGDQFPAYDLKAVVGGDLSKVDAKQPDDYFIQVTNSDNPRQVAHYLLLAQGLHIRLPDRDCRFRQAQRRV